MEWYIWAGFIAFILAVLLVDLFVLHRDAHAVSTKEAAIWSAVWIGLGLSFAVVVWVWLGGEAAGEYLAGYLIEKSLSVDNIFVFALIFGYFAVPDEFRHRVLFWGIFGALVMRFAFILAGIKLLEVFEPMIFVFGAFLLFTAWKMLRHHGVEIEPDANPVIRVVRRFVPLTDGYDGARLFTRSTGRLLATPLFAVLVVVEASDVLFAVDSIPAVFGVTRDPFLVFSSNAFAILGLRALYFLLADSIRRFRFLNEGLAAVLAVVGVKMIASEWIEVPVTISLSVVAAILTVAIGASLMTQPNNDQNQVAHHPLAGGVAGLRPRRERPDRKEGEG
ncbi:MAG: TerC family protein [Acidimicrobiia bacterium]